MGLPNCPHYFESGFQFTGSGHGLRLLDNLKFLHTESASSRLVCVLRSFTEPTYFLYALAVTKLRS